MKSLLILAGILLASSLPQEGNRWVWRRTRSLVLPEHQKQKPVFSSSHFSPASSNNVKKSVPDKISSLPKETQRNRNKIHDPAAKHGKSGLTHFGLPATGSSTNKSSSDKILISSYSSLDARPRKSNRIFKNFNPKSVAIRNSRKTTEGHIKDLEPFIARALPYDISALPLESFERAAGIQTLWNTITSRNRFSKLLNTILKSESFSSHKSIGSPKFNSVDTTSSKKLDSKLTNAFVRTFANKNTERAIKVPSILALPLESEKSSFAFTQLDTQPRNKKQRHDQLVNRLKSRAARLNVFQRGSPSVSDLNDDETTSTIKRAGRQSKNALPNAAVSNGQEFPFKSHFRIHNFTEGSRSSAPEVNRRGETSVKFANSSKPLVVRNLRLPGGLEVKMALVPHVDENDKKHKKTDQNMLESLSKMKFFEREDVLDSINEIYENNEILVAQELPSDEKQFILSTLRGDRIYPKKNKVSKKASVSKSPKIQNRKIPATKPKTTQSKPTSVSKGSNSKPKIAKSNQSSVSKGSNSKPKIAQSNSTLVSKRSNSKPKSPQSNPTSISKASKSDKTSISKGSQIDILKSAIKNRSFSPIDEFNPVDFNPFSPKKSSPKRSSKSFNPSLLLTIHKEKNESATESKIKPRGQTNDSAIWPWIIGSQRNST